MKHGKRNNKRYNPKSLQNLKPFEKGEDPRRNMRGAPKSNLSQLEELIGVKFDIALTKNDKYKIIESLLETPLSDLKHIAESQSAPVFIVNIAMAVLSDTKSGKTNTLDSLLDRFFGRARQENVFIGDKENPIAVNVNQESTLIIMPANGRDTVQPSS
jgi:hypothetical protein